MDEGYQVALAFFGLGVLWLFVSQFVLAIITFIRELIG
jgi:hypothetical protein